MRRPVSAPRRPGFAAAVVVLSALAPPGRARSAPAPGGGDVRLASVLVRSRAGLGRPFRLLYLGDSHVAGGAFPGAVDALLEETLGADVASRRHAVVGARADFLVRDGGGVLAGPLRRAAPHPVLVAYGTNEARDPDFEPGAYRATVEAIVSRLRAGTGGAAVALVGPPEQERRGNGGSFRPVPALASVSAVQAAAAEATGAVFVDLSVEMGGGAGFRRWTEEVPRRAVRALAGYANLREGIPTAGTASPVDDPRRVRLLGAALSGGDASGILQLADVGRVITPFPSRLPGASLAGGEGGVRLYQLPEPAGRAFFARSVRVADDDTVFRELSRGRFVPDAVAWVAPRPSPAPSVSTGRGYGVARVTADEPERLEASVSASAPSFLVLTRSYHPGWRASLDGREVPLHRVDLAFQGIEVPPGDHRLELRFRPVSHVVGAAVSGVSLVVLLALWLGGPSRRGEEP